MYPVTNEYIFWSGPNGWVIDQQSGAAGSQLATNVPRVNSSHNPFEFMKQMDPHPAHSITNTLINEHLSRRHNTAAGGSSLSRKRGTSESKEGAISTFDTALGHDGRTFAEHMIWRMSGLMLDIMLTSGMITESPSLIKPDVDDMEHLILSGARPTLRAPTLRSVLVEVCDDFRELASEVSQHLTDAGFNLEAKRHAVMFETGPYSTSFNQIWVRA